MPNTLISAPVADLERFLDAHRDVRAWTSADHEVHQNLLDIALVHGPVGGIRRKAARRTVAVVLFAYCTTLYAVTELVTALRGPQAGVRLDNHLGDVANGPLDEAEKRLRHGGDLLFRQQIERAGRRAVDVIDRLTTRLARG